MTLTECISFTEVMAVRIFSELYGAYFRIVSQVLTEHALTDKEVRDIVAKEGFRDSGLFLTGRLLPQKDNSDWGLLSRDKAGVLHPVTVSEPPHVLTALQKRWLRSKLDDPRICLFLDDRELAALCQRVADVEPLYQPDAVRYVDRYSDGDPFTDPDYRKNFRTILAARKKEQTLEIEFISRYGRRITTKCLPCKLEYSHRDDKFRVFCRTFNGRTCVINLARVVRVTVLHKNTIKYEPIDENALRCGEPLVIKVSSERRADERFLMEFAAYEKRTEREAGSDSLTVRIWYDKNDETDLLIRLLSYGPVLEITGPPAIRAKAAERVRRQYKLLHGE
ncbi:WYL domain-containing protein [uncultured Ruminococcus sp.]|uniref:WYL domain-containing protein n=1 Tax=uncultured Ruminococcus sp. TaxID=165186 RepID=UPI0025E5E954|nr:WYL domain-containing protein [uncultured Ruminococcus sp.]